jgi:opacity protein-like surface antigen
LGRNDYRRSQKEEAVMKRVFIASFVAGMLSFSTLLLPATARGEETYDRTGPYVGVGFAYGIENFGLGKLEDFAGTELSVDNSPGFDIRGGYRFHPNLAVEGDVQYFTGFDINEKGGGKLGTADTLAVTVDAKGYPLTGRFQPYGLLGLGFMRSTFDPKGGGDSNNDSVFAARLGVGADFYATENIVVFVEGSYMLPTADYKAGIGAGVSGDIIPLVVGGQYRF